MNFKASQSSTKSDSWFSMNAHNCSLLTTLLAKIYHMPACVIENQMAINKLWTFFTDQFTHWRSIGRSVDSICAPNKSTCIYNHKDMLFSHENYLFIYLITLNIYISCFESINFRVMTEQANERTNERTNGAEAVNKLQKTCLPAELIK